MSKYKICAYAICKNEEKFVDKWMDHALEADVVLVGDTGSDDNTVQRLKDRGALVYTLGIEPFRFDYCRNKCLELMPDDIDICVSSDMDEVVEKGWRERLENAWTDTTTRGHYLFNWSFNPDGTPAVQFIQSRIHARHGYKWIYPTHEILKYTGEGSEKIVFVEGLVYNHYPDAKKSRSFNLPLLELAVKEYPESNRNLHYLGREYMYAGMWDKCIQTLQRYLEHPDSVWKEERAASMRFIAKAYKEKGDIVTAKVWLYKAMAESPFLREPYVDMAFLAYSQKDWLGTYYYANEALKIKQKTFSYANEAYAWDAAPYDLAALGCYYIGLSDQAIEYSEQAVKLSPQDERLRSNHEIYLSHIKPT